MIREVSTYGTKEGSKTIVHNRKRFLEQIGQLSDGRIEIIYRRVYKKRSNPQNAFYWGIILQEYCYGYHEQTGETITKETAHFQLQQRFNFTELVNKETGEVLHVPKGTSKMSTVEFLDYTAECVRFISEWFGITVAEPGEQNEIHF